MWSNPRETFLYSVSFLLRWKYVNYFQETLLCVVYAWNENEVLYNNLKIIPELVVLLKNRCSKNILDISRNSSAKEKAFCKITLLRGCLPINFIGI